MDSLFFILALGGFLISSLTSVIGGGLFFSVPFMQYLFPQVSLGALVGNIKMGGFFRNLGNIVTNWKSINGKENVSLILPLFAGTVLGASLISDMNQKWILPTIIIAILLTENAPKLSQYITKRNFLLSSFLVGVWTGFFGASISILLLFLLRLKTPKDEDIAHTKIQARFIEWLTLIVAVIAHFFHGNLLTKIWLPWALGSILGGIVGGIFLKRMKHISGKTQKFILRCAFGVALVVSLGKFFS